MKTHHEVQLFLKMIDAKKLWSEMVISNTTKLLNHNSFFIARRAYWYLSKLKLSQNIQKKLKEFEVKHEDRL